MFIDIAKERFSVRFFKEKPVEKEKIEKILESAKIAPTAANYQPQKILILNEESALKKLEKATPYRFNAPLALVICYDENKCWQRKHDLKKSGEIDASIVATHMLLQIHDIGLGATWIMNFNENILRDNYNIPKNIIPVAILVCGYAGDNAATSTQHNNKKNISEITIYNNF